MSESRQNEPCFCLTELESSKRLLEETAKALPELKRQYDSSESGQRLYALLDIRRSAEALWAEFPKLLQNLAELEEDDLKATAKRLFNAVKAFDYLNTADYNGLCGALLSFAAMLPETGGVGNAQKIGHLMNNLKMGFFPTDPEHVRIPGSAVCFPETQVNLLDPCCGEGATLKIFAAGKNAVTYGTEIDEARCDKARKNIDKVGLGSFFHASVPYGCFHAVFLNPPYLSVPGPNGRKRLEKVFLSSVLPHLMPDGLLVYIIPYHRATEDVCRVIADNFAKLSVYRFRESEFKKFKQIVILGTKCKRRENPQLAEKLFNLALEPEKIPLIDSLPPERYSLPEKEIRVPYFRGAEFNVSELAEQLNASDSLNALFDRRTADNRERRPLLPLNLSQIGLVGASGMMNGLVACEHPHIIKGRIVKQKQTREEPGNKKGCTEIHETVSNKLIFNILTPGGMISVS